jgi:hypothetical protein
MRIRFPHPPAVDIYISISSLISSMVERNSEDVEVHVRFSDEAARMY